LDILLDLEVFLSGASYRAALRIGDDDINVD
jgi:hypothetical protein